MLILMSSTAATINLLTSATLAVLVLFAQDRLGLTEAGYGILLAAGALGGIPAGLLGPAIIRRIGRGCRDRRRDAARRPRRTSPWR